MGDHLRFSRRNTGHSTPSSIGQGFLPKIVFPTLNHPDITTLHITATAVVGSLCTLRRWTQRCMKGTRMPSLKTRAAITIILLIQLMTTLAMAQDKPSFADLSKATEELASQYVNLYYDLKFDEMEPLMHAEISFEDPTANIIFGSERVSGKAKVMENFHSAFAGISSMELEKIRSFASGKVAIFEMMITWTFETRGGKEVTIRDMPLIQVITIADGLVISHRDYGDYQIFAAQFREQTK